MYLLTAAAWLDTFSIISKKSVLATAFGDCRAWWWNWIFTGSFSEHTHDVFFIWTTTSGSYIAKILIKNYPIFMLSKKIIGHSRHSHGRIHFPLYLTKPSLQRHSLTAIHGTRFWLSHVFSPKTAKIYSSFALVQIAAVIQRNRFFILSFLINFKFTFSMWIIAKLGLNAFVFFSVETNLRHEVGSTHCPLCLTYPFLQRHSFTWLCKDFGIGSAHVGSLSNVAMYSSNWILHTTAIKLLIF